MPSAIRNTRQRRAILRALGEFPDPVTAEEISLRVHRDVPGIALSTVYRNLERMVEIGEVTRTVFEDGIARYEIPAPVHGHYLICTCCNRKVRIEHCPLHTLTKEIERETGFLIQDHQLQIYGLCPSCGKSRRQSL